MVDVQLIRIRLVLGGARNALARLLEVEDQRVVDGRRVLFVRLGVKPLCAVSARSRGKKTKAGVPTSVPLHLQHSLTVAHDGNEPQSVRQHLVLDYRGVVEDVAVLDGERVHLGHHDAAERIRNRSVDMLQVEFRAVLVVAEEIHLESLFLRRASAPAPAPRPPPQSPTTHIPEGFQIPLVVLARPVAWEIVAGDIRDRLGVDANNLRRLELGENRRLRAGRYISGV